MRAGLSVVGLLMVMLVVWWLSGRQLQTLKASQPPSAQGSASGAEGQGAAAMQAAQVLKALEQGAAARASDAAAQ